MASEPPYIPIGCALHSELELAAIQRRRVRLQLRDGRELRGIIADVWTEKGREYLRLRSEDGKEQVVDLAWMKSVG